VDKSTELIEQWKQLNATANKLLNKHTSFRTYNNVRLQMDKIESLLREGYSINVYSL
jgi:RecA-family ATPase